MISVQELRKSFGGQVALNGLTFSVPQGEIFGFVGPNGAGKTTAIRVLATLTAPDDGRARVAGMTLGEDDHEVRRNIGYMPDYFGVYDRLTAEEYLDFYAAAHRVDRRQRRRVVGELLELVDLGDRRAAQVDTLSRGQKQRLCLARALVHDPSVLLLDEPASGLDPRARVEMQDLVRELRDMGKTILISSHILPELQELCTLIGIIDAGKMVSVGRMEEVREQSGRGRRLRIELAFADDQALDRAAELTREVEGVLEVNRVDDHVEVTAARDFPDDVLLAHLVTRGIRVRSLAAVTDDLSEAFLQLTGRGEE